LCKSTSIRLTKEVPVVATTHSEPATRRDFLYIATGSAGAVAAGASVWPFVSQMAPDAAVIAAGAPIEVELKPVAEGAMIRVIWRGKPYFVRHRTKKEITEAQSVDVKTLPDKQDDSVRVKKGKEQWLVVAANCTHLGCVPLGNQGEFNGWFCPCHGSVFDTSGRIRKGPAPANLPVPPFEFLSDTKIKIG
jgi:ubiquinol-cytochrome c reductase iron-sulfur subunit